MTDTTVMALTQDNYRVEWVDLGEGLRGEYDPSNPDDVAMLRFDCLTLVDGEWEHMDHASYCTLMPADADNHLLYLGLAHIMRAIHGKDDVRRVCMDLSWINPGWFEEDN